MRVKITFEDYDDAQIVALAKIGQGDKAIMAQVDGKTKSQINYRLHKAKTIEKLEHGYRVAWRLGESEIVQMVKRDLLGIIRAEVQKNLPMQIDHPKPKTISIPQLKRKEAHQAILARKLAKQ